MRPQPALPPTGPDALRAELARWQDVAAHATALRWDVPGVPGTFMWVMPVTRGWAVCRTGGLAADWWTGTAWFPAVDEADAQHLTLPDAVGLALHLRDRESAHDAAWTRPAGGPHTDEHLDEYATPEGVAA